MIGVFKKGDDTVTAATARLSKELKTAEAQRDKLVGQRADAQREAERASEVQKALSPDADVSAFTKANERVAAARTKATAFDVTISELDHKIADLWAKIEHAEERAEALKRADQIDANLATLARSDEAVIAALKARIEAYEAFGTGGAAEGAKGRLQQVLNEVIIEGRTVAAIYGPVADKLRSGDVKINKPAPVQQQTAPMPEMAHGTASIGGPALYYQPPTGFSDFTRRPDSPAY
jgi:hypothetical protein